MTNIVDPIPYGPERSRYVEHVIDDHITPMLPPALHAGA